MFSCLTCTYTTSDRRTIERHKMVHTGEKPYACTDCSFRTSRRDTLNNHIRCRHPETFGLLLMAQQQQQDIGNNDYVEWVGESGNRVREILYHLFFKLSHDLSYSHWSQQELFGTISDSSEVCTGSIARPMLQLHRLMLLVRPYRMQALSLMQQVATLSIRRQ